MDDIEGRQRQSNLCVLIFIIAMIVGTISVSKYLDVGDDDAAAAYVVMFYVLSFMTLHLVMRNIRKIIFSMGSIYVLGSLFYISVIASGSEQKNVQLMLVVSFVMSAIVFAKLIYNKAKIDIIDTQS